MADSYDPRISITGAGRPIVLVSGMDGTGQLFYTQVPRLARSLRVATYALRDSATDMATLVADLHTVIETVAPRGEPIMLLGESFGGALSMSYALAHPDRVAALVVLNSFPAFLPQARLHLGHAALRVVPWGAMAIVRRLTAFRMHSRHTTKDELRRFLQLMRATTREGYLNRLMVLMKYDVRDQLALLRVPTLFVAADRDHLVPSVEQARFMAARVPGASMRVSKGMAISVCLRQISTCPSSWANGSASRTRPPLGGERPVKAAPTSMNRVATRFPYCPRHAHCWRSTVEDCPCFLSDGWQTRPPARHLAFRAERNRMVPLGSIGGC